ncbi:carboxymuconolactone decarboxylase family protein [Pseudacidovorax intermedius]|uniref:carboxymuconolactone decarboxylase family protein n=1 Tax=Pseudacidovorax intermedius TaxID=433924 RepID=UPI0026EE0D14|nr:carboxymuconolactone decarboxylase family protein [Pseudacidovorax intermedius]
MSVSTAFALFMKEAPAHAAAWSQAAQALGAASSLDAKTQALSYLAVLAAIGNTAGVPFHAQAARDLGATRQEVASAVLIGLPAAGATVIASLPAALAAYDAPSA